MVAKTADKKKGFLFLAGFVGGYVMFLYLISMLAILAFPTWWVTTALVMTRLLPEDHPWHSVGPSFNSWCKAATVITVIFGILFWFAGIGLAIAVHYLL